MLKQEEGEISSPVFAESRVISISQILSCFGDGIAAIYYESIFVKSVVWSSPPRSRRFCVAAIKTSFAFTFSRVNSIHYLIINCSSGFKQKKPSNLELDLDYLLIV